ncbi:MAG: Crp/Fnr family transcriptional regulator [Microscillaceae bacterium]
MHPNMFKPDKLLLFFSNEFPFNKEGLELFIASFELKIFKKNELILENGIPEKQLRFLDEGIVREFYSKDGKEKNINFYMEPGFIMDFYSFVSDKPSPKNQECITDVRLRVLSKEKFQYFLSEYECGKLFVEDIFQRVIEKRENEQFQHFMNTAEENYLHIVEQKLAWLQKIPQYHIASYLGISPETLSRIRRRMMHRPIS